MKCKHKYVVFAKVEDKKNSSAPYITIRVHCAKCRCPFHFPDLREYLTSRNGTELNLSLRKGKKERRTKDLLYETDICTRAWKEGEPRPARSSST